MNPAPQTDTPVLSAADDPDVTDEQIGKLVRMYRNTMRPPQVIVTKPSWYDKAQLLIGLFIVFSIFFAVWYTQGARTRTEDKVDREIYILCDLMRQTQDIELPNECVEVLPGK